MLCFTSTIRLEGYLPKIEGAEQWCFAKRQQKGSAEFNQGVSRLDETWMHRDAAAIFRDIALSTHFR